MDTTKQIARAVLNKNFAEAKELVFKSLYARASLSLDEARYAVADAVFNGQEQIDEVSPPGMEKMTGSKKVKAAFTKRYGKRGKEVMYATAWKQHNKKMAEGTELEEGSAVPSRKEALDAIRWGKKAAKNPAKHGVTPEDIAANTKVARDTLRPFGSKKSAPKKVAEEAEQIDEISKATKDSYVAKRGSQLSSMMRGPEKNYASMTGKKQTNAVKGIKRAMGVKEETEQLDEVMTRKHFQQVADVIKSHPDAKKREELAAHHSEIFKKSNPRFDADRFRKACGVGGCK